MGKCDTLATDHAGNGTDVMSHAPTLVASEIADGRVTQSTITGNRRQCCDQRDQRKIDIWQTAVFQQTCKNVVNVRPVAEAVLVDVFKFDRFSGCVMLPIVFGK